MDDSEKANILVVDDIEENIEALKILLCRPDLNIFSAMSGREALKLLFQYDFALVLLDVKMPVMDGFETAKLMQDNEKTRHVPIIFVTADYKNIIKGYKAGAVDYIFKPIDSFILEGKVNIFLKMYKQKRFIELANQKLKKALEEVKIANSSIIDIH